MRGFRRLTGLLRECVTDVPNGSKVAFTGSVEWCPPIAELLAYSVKWREFDLAFIPLADPADARRMPWPYGAGFSVSDEGAELRHADVLIILGVGGLAMPKIVQEALG